MARETAQPGAVLSRTAGGDHSRIGGSLQQRQADGQAMGFRVGEVES